MIRTQYFPQTIDPESATSIYETLMQYTEWDDGIYSRKVGRPSRKAYSVNINNSNELDLYIIRTVSSVMENIDILDQTVSHIYVNYYRDGNDFCPTHRHKGTKQLIISLGVTRTLKVGTKYYDMNSGDVIVFGSSNHGVPQQEHITEGRISIAVFIVKDV